MPEKVLDMIAGRLQAKQRIIEQIGKFAKGAARVAVFEKIGKGPDIEVFNNHRDIVHHPLAPERGEIEQVGDREKTRNYIKVFGERLSSQKVIHIFANQPAFVYLN
jgi:hypothetical protein